MKGAATGSVIVQAAYSQLGVPTSGEAQPRGRLGLQRAHSTLLPPPAYGSATTPKTSAASSPRSPVASSRDITGRHVAIWQETNRYIPRTPLGRGLQDLDRDRKLTCALRHVS